MVKFDKVTKKYGNRIIFKDFSCEFPKHGIVAVIGDSGSGKSTLLNMIDGLDTSYGGQIFVNGICITNLDNNELSDFRIKDIGYVFQNFNLLNLQTAFDNIYLPLDTISSSSPYIKRRRVNELLNLLGISKLKNKTVNKLSGGEKQRVAIARALVNEPSVILCDEPTGALDEKNSNQIFEILKQISKNTLVVMASHDIDEVEKIADYIVSIKNEVISVKKHENICEYDKKLLIGSGRKFKKSSMSMISKIKYAISKNKNKKYRSLIMNMMLSLSLTGTGLAIIISDSVSSKVNLAFSEILNGNQIVVTNKNENANVFSKAYSASYDDVTKVYEKYKEKLDGYGVSYLVNFEDFFKDRNEFKISFGTTNIYLPSLSARSINDFQWLENDLSSVYYPTSVDAINDDQIVLGLSYKDMVDVCFGLKIQRSFTSLGHYIHENGMFLTMSFENQYWQYDDEQIFEVVAVCESNETSLFHSNRLWNEVVFEELMRMPSDDDENHYYPWEMYKIYYLKTKHEVSEFLDLVLYDEECYDFVFERISQKYSSILCGNSGVCDENRLFMYIVDKFSINASIVNKFFETNNDLKSYYFTSQFGYCCYGSTLFSGFSKNIFVSLDDQLLDDAIDADTALTSDSSISIDLPDGIVQGNFLNSLSDGLRFSSLYKVINGRDVRNLNEIVISSGLAKVLDSTGNCLGKYLNFAGEIEEIMNSEGIVEKTYSKTKSVIVGITNETKNYVYHNPSWSISFFRDKLGVSNFNLIPTSLVFELKNDVDVDKTISKFEKQFPNFNFVSPISELNKSINSTLEYANVILMSFSLLSIIISSLLLGTVILLNIIESKDEIVLFSYLGIRQKDVNSLFVYEGVMHGLLAFFFSSFEIIAVDFVISYFLGEYLGVSLAFSLNLKPIFVILLIAIILPILIAKIMGILLSKQNKK